MTSLLEIQLGVSISIDVMPIHTYSRLSSTTYHIYKGKCIYFRSTRVHQYFQSLALADFLSEIKATEMEIIGHCKLAEKLKKIIISSRMEVTCI